ncbi:MAG: SDR family oxidoreductase [Flavobacteriaceae bacterium]
MDQTALITGASSGIGESTAYVYAKNGYHLILVARRLEKLNTIKKQIEDKYSVDVSVFELDLSQLNAAEKLFNKVTNANLNVDVLINNAGVGIYKKFEESTIEKEEQMLLLNVVTLTKLTKLFLPQMIKKEAGNIINIASTAAYQAVPSLAIYAATKAYVLSFSEAIAYELKDKNIVVTAICPGATQSEFGINAGFGEDAAIFNKMPSSKDLALFIFKAMKSKKTNTIHGFKNKFLAFSNRFAPRKLTAHIAFKIMN